MKMILSLLALALSTSAFSCTDFSGEYLDSYDGTYYSIAQNGCESIEYIYDEGSMTFPADGVEYLVSSNEIVVEEGKVLAVIDIYESNKFEGAKLIATNRIETSYTSGDHETEKFWEESFLDSKKDLISIAHYEDGSIEKSLSRRVSK